MRLGILGSTRGTNLLSIIEAINKGDLDASIEVVISNKRDALILEKARAHGFPAEFICAKNTSRNDYDLKLHQVFQSYQVELVVLIGYMRLLSADFVQLWQNKVINIHPSLLPAFAGMMDLTVHQAVLDAGIEETGCTVHFVTEELDGGPIIVQKTCPVLINDTAESLKKRVQALEGVALIESIQLIDELSDT